MKTDQVKVENEFHEYRKVPGIEEFSTLYSRHVLSHID
jgi:hypothetical protein